MLAADANAFYPFFRIVQPVLRTIVIGIYLERLGKSGCRGVILRQLCISDAQIVKHVRIVLFQLRRLAVLPNRLTVLAEIRISLPEIVMSLGVVAVLLKVFLVSLDRFFVLSFRLLTLSERFIPQAETKMSFGEIGVEPNRLRKRLHRLSVVIVAIQLLSFIQLGASPRAVARRIVGHLRPSGTIIRVLLTTAFTTTGYDQ